MNETMNENVTELNPINSTGCSPITWLTSASWWFYLISGLLDQSLAIPANGWSLYVIVSGWRNLLQSEIITLNLVVNEIGFSWSFLLMIIIRFSGIYSWSNLDAVFNLVQFHWFIQHVSVIGRSLFQCLICVERYLAVAHPLFFLRYVRNLLFF